MKMAGNSHNIVIPFKLVLFTVIINVLCTAQYTTICSDTDQSNCTVCEQTGYYGENCSIPCHCHDNLPCDRLNGSCPYGCQQWFAQDPNLGIEDNCKLHINMLPQPNAELEGVTTTNATIRIRLDHISDPSLAPYYYYKITCIKFHTGDEIESVTFPYIHNKTIHYKAVTVGGLEMFTQYLTRVVGIREQNNVTEEGEYLPLQMFTTQCDRPAVPKLHGEAWPQQSVYIHWDKNHMHAGCTKAIIHKITLYYTEKASGKELNKWHSRVLPLDANNTVFTHLHIDTYDFMLRIENNDLKSADSAVVTVSVAEDDSIVLVPKSHQNLWLAIMTILSFLLVICFIIIIVTVRLFYKKRVAVGRYNNFHSDLSLDNCDALEDYQPSDDVLSKPYRYNGQSNGHTLVGNGHNYTANFPLNDVNTDRHMNNNRKYNDHEEL